MPLGIAARLGVWWAVNEQRLNRSDLNPQQLTCGIFDSSSLGIHEVLEKNQQWLGMYTHVISNLTFHYIPHYEL